MSEITGEVSGIDNFDKYRVVIYSKVDYWFVQPFDINPYTEITTNGTWSTSIHLGKQYAALLVDKSFNPPKQSVGLPDGVQIITKTISTP